jgi:hypothetical protein
MAKAQIKLRETAPPNSKGSARFQVVREGEPIPEIATEPLRKPAIRRPPSRRARMSSKPDCCPLCGGVITRFDGEVFLLHGRCAPCHEALKDVPRL